MKLTQRLFLLAFVALLPAIAIQTYNEFALRKEREAEVRDLAQGSARLAASEIERLFDGVRNLLTAVAKVDSVQALDTPACVAYLAKLQPEVPHLVSLAAIDRDAILRCRSEMPSSPVSYSDRDYIREALRTADFAVGGFTQARIANQAVLPFALPLRDAKGQVIGVVATALDLRWLSARLRERGLPPGGSLTVADRNGVILAREPLPERFIGTRIPDSFLHLVSADAPGATEVISQDGARRVLGYVPSPSIYVSAGLSADASYEAVERLMGEGLVLVGSVFAMAMLAAWLFGRAFIQRPMNRLLAATDAWRAGDLTTRTGLTAREGDFGRLGQEFDRAIGEISRRDASQKLLMDELNHRVKNTLATVQSLASQTLRSARNPDEFRDSFEARLLALSRTHDLLTRTQWQAADLQALIDKELTPYRSGEASRYDLIGADMHVDPRVALALGLAFHELATNAVKHGALSRPEGRIDIGWRLQEPSGTGEPRLRIEWRESGGPAVALPQRKGFGSRLLERTVKHELNGLVDVIFDEAGLVCVMEIPFPDGRPSAAAPAEQGGPVDTAPAPVANGRLDGTNGLAADEPTVTGRQPAAARIAPG